MQCPYKNSVPATWRRNKCLCSCGGGNSLNSEGAEIFRVQLKRIQRTELGTCFSGGVPVRRGGEHPQDDVSAVHPDDGAGGVEQVEVEVGVAGDRAVQASLQEGRPLLLEDALGAAAIALAHPGHA